MRFRRKRSNVRWLPDESWLSQTTGVRFANPPNAVVTGSQEIIQSDTATPSALNPSGNFGRLDMDQFILDSITGKVCWDIEGNGGGGGDADAVGNWIFQIRMAIFIQPTMTHISGTTALDVESTSGTVLGATSLDPGATTPALLQGSYQPEGFRILWRRSWMTLINFASGFGRDGVVSSEDVAPPAGYVHIKPKRLLKASDKLRFGWAINTLAGAGAADTARVWISHDLRTAAHHTSRRR